MYKLYCHFKNIENIDCININLASVLISRGHAVEKWLSHCATNRKVTGSIPDGVIGMFH
jgi:hypothetical protein